MEEKYLALINSVPPEAVPAKVFDLCKQASVAKDFVVGLAQCCLAWKSRVNPSFIVRAMADAYIQRVVPPQGKLGILYIFNDIVQKDPASFALVGHKYFLRLIAPLVNQLPENIMLAHSRVLNVLAERNIYTSDQVSELKRTFDINPQQEHQVVLDILNIPEDDKYRQIYKVNGSEQLGRTKATTLASKSIFGQRKIISDHAQNWANLLLKAAIGDADEVTAESLSKLDPDSRESLRIAVNRALVFTRIELQVLQFMLVDWSLTLEADVNRCKLLMEVLKQG